MPTITNKEFTKRVEMLRNSMDFEEFNTALREFDQFTMLVDIVETNSNNWGNKVGFGKTRVEKEERTLSDREMEWKKFFRDHSFNTSGDLKNFADAFSIVEGIDLSRFIRVDKDIPDRFPGYISIVPIRNENEHNYKIGEPVFSFGRGVSFYRKQGSSGNSMSSNIKDYRISTRPEIESILSNLIYLIPSVAQNLTDTLIG
jgi:hypothetical protein